MKRILILGPAAVVLCCCGTTKQSAQGTQNATTRAMKHSSTTGSNNSDEVVVTGTQYIPVLGKSESGVRHELEGAWVLESMPGADGSSNANNIAGKGLPAGNETGKDYNGTMMSDKMKNSKEMRRDSSVKKLPNGVTETTTTVYLMDKDGNQGNKITPPQSANPNVHIPEKPSLNFFGSNETFAGFTGCNKISGRYTLAGNSISFQNASPSTKMVCIGEYDENTFINTLRRVNSFKATGGKLELMEGSNVLLVFNKK